MPSKISITHPESNKEIVGYGLKHLTKNWNLHVIQERLNGFVEDEDAITGPHDLLNYVESNVEVPTKDNTVAEIKKYLDQEGIEYTSKMVKKDLVKLL